MIKYLRSMSFGKVYYIEQENTKQIGLFEYIERIDKERFKFKYLHNGQTVVFTVNQMKRILSEYNGTLDGKSCEKCKHFEKSEGKQSKNKALANCKNAVGKSTTRRLVLTMKK